MKALYDNNDEVALFYSYINTIFCFEIPKLKKTSNNIRVGLFGQVILQLQILLNDLFLQGKFDSLVKIYIS